MEDEPVVQVVRESSRTILKLNRQIYRDKQSDVRRNLEDISASEANIREIVNKLKSKSITCADLNILKNAIFNNPNVTTVVLSTHGSLRGLVREISGTDVERQLAAAGCCCNLALGDSKTCMIIAKAVGSYLTTTLDNPSMEIAATAAWTLGNLAGSGAKPCEMLMAQGALSKLTTVLTTSSDVVDAALYALTHFAYQMEDTLRKEYVEKLVDIILKLKPSLESTRVLFTLSCHSDFDLTHEELLRVLHLTSVSIEKHCKQCVGSNLCCEIVFLIRTLANSNMNKNGMTIVNYLETSVSVDYIKMVLNSNNSVVAESVFWLLGNLYNCCGESNLVSNLVK